MILYIIANSKHGKKFILDNFVLKSNCVCCARAEKYCMIKIKICDHCILLATQMKDELTAK